MERFINIQRTILTLQDFEQYPIWVWNDSNDAMCPLSERNVVPPEYQPAFVFGRFRTASGHELNGYLIGGDSFFAFGLFVGEKKFVINLNLPNLINKNVVTIRSLLADPSFELFPVSYESPICFSNGSPIKGNLALK
jgi:hypothetical protein